MNKANKLTLYQRTALCQSQQLPPTFIWNPRMFRIYERVSKDNLLLSDGQTYEQFLEIEQRAPNEEGTGRFKFAQIRKIQYLLLGKAKESKNLQPRSIHLLANLVHQYLRIPIQLINSPQLVITKKKTVVEEQEKVEFAVRQSSVGLQANDILSVLLEYREEDTIIVGLADCELYQQEDGEEVDGRACGDGAAVISYLSQNKRKTAAQFLYVALTLLHQILHTLGFDHCKAWTCLMNAISNFEGWLCPACTRKLYHELSISSHEAAKQWIRGVIKSFADLSAKDQTSKGKLILGTF